MRQETARKAAPAVGLGLQGPESALGSIFRPGGPIGTTSAPSAAVKGVFQALIGLQQLNGCPDLVRANG